MRHITRLVLVLVMSSLPLALAGSVWAFAVGELTVQSRRGEPLAAHIRLVLQTNERSKDIVVTLGSQEDYRAEGKKRPPFLDAVRAAVSGTRETIRLSSTVAIQDPAFDLVLSVRSGQITIVKHHRVTVPGPLPVPVPAPAVVPIVAEMTPAVPAPKPRRTPARSTPRRPARYGPVERGETLYSVLRHLRIPSDKLWQAAVIVWQANKEQFQGGNLHGLPVGAFLEIPGDLSEQLATIQMRDAAELVAAQWDTWQTVQRASFGKSRVVVATREGQTTLDAPPQRSPAGKRVTRPPAEPSPETGLPAQAVVLPVGAPGNMVSMADLQTALQGFEERLLRRMISPPPSQPQEIKAPTALVSTLDLQSSIQSLEERLTQRMQHALVQTSEPVQVGSRVALVPAAVTPAAPAAETTHSMLLVLLPYVIVLTNVVLLLLGGGLVWFWLRRRDRAARIARL